MKKIKNLIIALWESGVILSINFIIGTELIVVKLAHVFNFISTDYTDSFTKGLNIALYIACALIAFAFSALIIYDKWKEIKIIMDDKMKESISTVGLNMANDAMSGLMSIAKVHKIQIYCTLPIKGKIKRCIITVKGDKVKIKPKKSLYKKIRKFFKKIYYWWEKFIRRW